MDGFADLQWYDFMRMGTVLAAFLSLIRFGRLVRRDHPGYSTKLKEWAWVIFAVLFTLFTGALESILKNTDYRYGAFLSFLITLAILHASRDDGQPLQSSIPRKKLHD